MSVIPDKAEYKQAFIAMSKEQMSQCDGQQQNPRRVVSCDQEAWVKSRLRYAISAAAKVRDEVQFPPDNEVAAHALDGIVNGTAIEIIHTLGLEPEYTNLRRR